MRLIDANLLLYAYDSTSPRYEPVRRWLEEVMTGDEEVGLAIVSLLTFLRIGTNPRCSEPRSHRRKRSGPSPPGWIDRTCPGTATEVHWSVLQDLCRAGRARGPLLMDAHLAALAVEHGAVLCTTDRDLARFPGIRIDDPLPDRLDEIVARRVA